eukprot:438713_1
MNDINIALKCPIYKSMKQSFKFTEDNIDHLYNFTHFRDEFNAKPKCKYQQQCKAFTRIANGGNRLDDRCHIKLYNHPPRNDRQIKLAQNTSTLVVHEHYADRQPCRRPINEMALPNYAKRDDITYLINEVISNGYQYDLCLECGQYDDCKHSDYSILKIVDEKMQDLRHKHIDSPLNRGEMLSLILYTGYDCNYDLCKSQRNGDFSKWKWFDY